MRRRGFLLAAAAILTAESFLGARKVQRTAPPKDLRTVSRCLIDGQVYELMGPPTISFVMSPAGADSASPYGLSIGGTYARRPA